MRRPRGRFPNRAHNAPAPGPQSGNLKAAGRAPMSIRARGPRGDTPRMGMRNTVSDRVPDRHPRRCRAGIQARVVAGERALSAVRAWPAALVVLGATVVAINLVQVAERDRAAAESAALSTARAKQLRELVSGHLATLELRAQNAGTNPRLVAALGGNVSRETLRDLFSTESWWQPFRESFASTYLAAPGGQVTFIAGGSEVSLPADALVARVRASRWVASALVAADGRVHAVVAVPVLMPNPAHTPVLLLDPAVRVPGAGADRRAHRRGGGAVRRQVGAGGRGPVGADGAAAPGDRPRRTGRRIAPRMQCACQRRHGGGHQRGGARPVAAGAREHRDGGHAGDGAVHRAAGRAWA